MSKSDAKLKVMVLWASLVVSLTFLAFSNVKSSQTLESVFSSLNKSEVNKDNFSDFLASLRTMETPEDNVADENILIKKIFKSKKRNGDHDKMMSAKLLLKKKGKHKSKEEDGVKQVPVPYPVPVPVYIMPESHGRDFGDSGFDSKSFRFNQDQDQIRRHRHGTAGSLLDEIIGYSNSPVQKVVYIVGNRGHCPPQRPCPGEDPGYHGDRHYSDQDEEPEDEREVETRDRFKDFYVVGGEKKSGRGHVTREPRDPWSQSVKLKRKPLRSPYQFVYVPPPRYKNVQLRWPDGSSNRYRGKRLPIAKIGSSGGLTDADVAIMRMLRGTML